MSATCPTCGSQIAPLEMVVCRDTNTAARFGLTVKLSAHGAAILRTLLDKHPHTTTMEHLAACLWGAQDGPKDEAGNIRVTMYVLRRAIAPLGVRITNEYGGKYRLALDSAPAWERVA